MKNKKVIAHILMSDRFSGAENVAITILENLDTIRFKGYYICKRGPIEDILKKRGINYILLDSITVKSLRRCINAIHADVLHCHDFKASVISSLAFNNIKIISHIHQNPTWIKSINIKTILYRICQRKINTVISVSDAFFKEYVFTNSINNKIVLKNIIDINKLLPGNIIDVKKDIDVLYVGRLANEKDPLKCLTIFKCLHSKNNSLKFGIVGDGVLAHDCQVFIRENHLDEVIKLYGFQETVSSFYERSKIFINTSKWEGFGLSCVEALAFGLPVVCSNTGGLKEIITEECGKLCNNNDEYVDEILKLCEDESYYRKKSSYAKKHVLSFDNVKHYIDKLSALYS